MKTVKSVVMVVAVLAAGCASPVFEKYLPGVTEDAVTRESLSFLDREGFTGALTAEQIQRFIAAAKANEEMKALGAEVAMKISATPALQDRIAELAAKILPALRGSTNAPAVAP